MNISPQYKNQLNISDYQNTNPNMNTNPNYYNSLSPNNKANLNNNLGQINYSKLDYSGEKLRMVGSNIIN